MRDRSLDEFLDDGTEDEHDPATAHWTPDGAVCAECGETVSRLWNDDGRDCCGSCKEW